MKSFEQMNEEGASRFGSLWVDANQIALQVAQAYGMDPKDPTNKQIMTALILGLLNRLMLPMLNRQVDELFGRLWRMWIMCKGELEKNGVKNDSASHRALLQYVNEEKEVLEKMKK